MLEDYPGLAKTLIARSFAQVIGVSFSRIQFTPDLLPADITGSLIYDQRRGEFAFKRGPIFTDFLLGDEINRAPPKTQSALLEAMQEGQVTVEETTYPLGEPFVVIATENPIEFEGTYPLPEAQLDRFLLRCRIGYPDRNQEWEILRRRAARDREEIQLDSVIDSMTLLSLQRVVEEVHISESIGFYIIDLVTATREHRHVEVGASPRGALALMKAARVKALLDGRDFVTPDDVKAVAIPALAHRLSLHPESWVKRVTGDDIVAGVLHQIAVPRD